MARPLFLIVPAALALLAGCGPREAQPTPPVQRLQLSAAGEVAAAPDMARLTAGVVAEAPTAAEAMAGQRAAMTSVMTALTDAGLPAADIQTTSLELLPVYEPYDPARGQDGVSIVGYRAANRVSITARDLDLLGSLLDALVDSGVNDISNIAFDVSGADALLDEARRDAVAKLRARAGLYAEAAGVRLGRLLEMSESAGYVPMMREMSARADMAPTPIAGGELTLSVTVMATFEIEG